MQTTNCCQSRTWSCSQGMAYMTSLLGNPGTAREGRGHKGPGRRGMKSLLGRVFDMRMGTGTRQQPSWTRQGKRCRRLQQKRRSTCQQGRAHKGRGLLQKRSQQSSGLVDVSSEDHEADSGKQQKMWSRRLMSLYRPGRTCKPWRRGTKRIRQGGRGCRSRGPWGRRILRCNGLARISSVKGMGCTEARSRKGGTLHESCRALGTWETKGRPVGRGECPNRAT